VTAFVTCFHPAPFVHVLASTVEVVPVVLSFNVAVAQSYVTVSGHVTLYQNPSCVDPVGAVNVWLIDEVPLGLVDPTKAA